MTFQTAQSFKNGPDHARPFELERLNHVVVDQADRVVYLVVAVTP